MEERHAHEVLEMLVASGGTWSRSGLAAEIRSTFGEGARFTTCSSSGLTPEELIDMLAAKGKFSGTEANFYFDPERRCGH